MLLGFVDGDIPQPLRKSCARQRRPYSGYRINRLAAS
jgi:hypothetical protein